MSFKSFISFICICLMFIPSAVGAQSRPANSSLDIPLLSLADGEQDVGDALSPLRRGQRAPFTGVLVSNHATAILLVDRLSLTEQCRINTEHELGIQRAESQLSIDNLQAHIQAMTDESRIEREANVRRVADLTNTLNRIQNNPVSGLTNTLHTILWVSGGIVVGVGLGLLLSLIVK